MMQPRHDKIQKDVPFDVSDSLTSKNSESCPMRCFRQFIFKTSIVSTLTAIEYKLLLIQSIGSKRLTAEEVVKLILDAT